MPTWRVTPRRVLHSASWRLRRVREKALSPWYRRAGVRLSSRGLKARGASASDAYVFGEIFGAEDAYRLDVVLPLMRGGTVVEVGAHKGYFTILAASTAARVLVYEPDARNYSYVLHNLELNGLDNVTAVQAAVTDTCGTRSLTVSDITDARHTFFRSAFSGTGTSVEVPCVSLPAALDQHGVQTVDLLKLDCEGSEYDALLGCDARTLSRVSHIVAELHESPTIPHRRDDLVRHLAAHGFTAEIYDERTRVDVRTCMAFFSRTATASGRPSGTRPSCS